MELNSSSIRFVKVEKSGGQFLPRLLDVPLSPDLYREGQAVNRKGFGQAVRTAMRDQLGVVPSDAAVSLGAQNVLIRRLGLPKLKGPALRDLMETQGDQWIPFLREGAAFDLVVVDPNVNEFQQEVLLVAVPLRIIRGIQETLASAGLRLAVLDVDIAALYRAGVAVGAAPADGVVGIVDLTGDRPRLGLFQGGLLVGARTLDSRALRGPGAQWGLSGYGDDLPVDIRRTLELMVTQLRHEVSLNAVVVMGTPARELLDAMDREFRSAMAGRLAPDFRLTLATGPNLSPDASVGFGLGLAQMGQPRTMNLLPQASIGERRSLNVAWLFSILLLAVLGVYGLIWSLQMPLLDSQERTLQSQLTQVKTFLAREPAIAKEEARAVRLQPVINDLMITDPWHVAYPRLKGLLPAGVRLTRVGGVLPDLQIAGTAPAPEQVAELLNALEKSSYFDSPVLASSGTGTTVSFTLSVKMAPREVKAK